MFSVLLVVFNEMLSGIASCSISSWILATGAVFAIFGMIYNRLF